MAATSAGSFDAMETTIVMFPALFSGTFASTTSVVMPYLCAPARRCAFVVWAARAGHAHMRVARTYG